MVQSKMHHHFVFYKVTKLLSEKKHYQTMLFLQVEVVVAVTSVQNKPFVKIKDDVALVMGELVLQFI